MLLIVSLRLRIPQGISIIVHQSDLTPALDCPMNKPNASGLSVAERFTAIQSKLKECHELMDSIGSEPYIPSYRHDQMCFISDKLNNVQQNVHSLAMNLAHLG